MKIEVSFGDVQKQPKIKKVGDGWTVVGESSGNVAYRRAVWVRVFSDDSLLPKDGKGFLIGPEGKLRVG